MFELNDVTRAILGTPAVLCYHWGKALRAMGHTIPDKCEEEQAYVIYWMLCLYETHGANWRAEAKRLVAEAKTALESAPPVATHSSAA